MVLALKSFVQIWSDAVREEILSAQCAVADKPVLS